ncbi:metalloendopeptidase OMA1, mitochondrial-like isoform X2 [Antedon mediterranea]|uniref:metalloendopeptidase OMA1, mitochondrial-like isoform X2 n=1 Tax=Antedon mediterranea TaxID=105859 RepID=UPI003AF7ED9A
MFNLVARMCSRLRCNLSPIKLQHQSKSACNNIIRNFNSIAHKSKCGQYRQLYNKPYVRSSIRVAVTKSCNFHTSQPKNAGPLLALLLKPITKGVAIISGRVFRQWWKGLPKEKRKYFIEVLQKNKYRILAFIGGTCFVVGVFYVSHLQTTPITNRRRVIFFSESQLAKIAAVEYEKQCMQFDKKFVDSENDLYRIVEDVASQLIKHNQHIPEIKNKTWIVHIVNDPQQKNAFVLPNGQIFVFTGMFHAVKNEQQLGIILAHELAHVVLNHAAEQISFLEFFDWLMIVVLAGLWAFLPNDGLAIVASWFKNKVSELLIQMPYSRGLELEADEVGLQLAATSCFDVRESQVFWEMMADASEKNDELDVEWLSTHPTHENRAKKFEV